MSADSLRKAAKGSLYFLFGEVVSRVFGTALHLLVSNLCGAAVLGRYAITIFAVDVAQSLGMIGLNRGGMHFVSIFYDKGDVRGQADVMVFCHLTALVTSNLAMLLLLGCTPLLASGWFHDPGLTPCLRWMAFGVPFAVFLRVGSFLSRGFHTTKYSLLSMSLVTQGSLVLLFLFLFWTGMGDQAVFLANSLSKALGAGFIFVLLWILLSRAGGAPTWSGVLRPEKREVFRRLLAYSTPFIFIEMLGFVLNFTDVFMLGHFSNASEVGQYSAAYRVASLLLIVLHATNSIFAPLVSSLHARGDEGRKELFVLYRGLTRWMMILSLPMLAFLFVSCNAIMALFGEEFTHKGPDVLLLVSLGSFFNLATGGVGVILAQTGYQSRELFNTLVSGCLNVVLNLLLIPGYGAVGAAAATLMSTIVVNLLRVCQVRSLFGIHPFTVLHLSFPVAGALLVALFVYGYPAAVMGGAVRQFSIGTVGAVVLFAGLVLCCTDEYDRQLGRSLLGRFVPRLKRV